MKRYLLLMGICSYTTVHAQTKPDSIQLIQNMAKLYDLEYTNAEADSLLDNVNYTLEIYKGMHQTLPANSIPYPFAFNPLPFGNTVPVKQEKINWVLPDPVLPANKNELAF
ncbi:MAG: hypothetical protein JSU05_13920, partial [Bacteroidetes bacterium]|nr:hypothetical protein [Bacteroidota bacterium]